MLLVPVLGHLRDAAGGYEGEPPVLSFLAMFLFRLVHGCGLCLARISPLAAITTHVA